MESAGASYGAERDERNSRPKARERTPLSLNLFVVTLVAFVLLLLAKAAISGLYLRLTPLYFSATNLALAQEDKTRPDPAIEERERTLRKRERELSDREMLLKKREEGLVPLKNEIDAKLEELNDLQTRLTAFAKKLAERENALKDAKISHLVALYSSMEPAKAAVIMDKLNIDTIVRIFKNMKGKSAGKILAVMKPEKGAMISERLSQLD